jgi:uncharacterized protein
MLIDTSGFLCLYDETEQQHQKAVSFYDATEFRLATNYVLAEYVALAHVRGVPRQEIIKFSSLILTDDDIKIVWVDETLHTKAVELMQQRQDKTYSLCDSVSFIIMREQNINEALTTDKHFEQEGFIRLLQA